jgi:hypothetical protein
MEGFAVSSTGIHFSVKRVLGILTPLVLLAAQVGALPAEPEPVQPLNSDAVNLTGASFLEAYLSPDRDRKEKALLYLLGVQDATEGKSWCSYRQFKTITLQEFVYQHLKGLPPQRLGERASALIEEALKGKAACGGKR